MPARLELADILRRHGPTYRELHAEALSREQLRVMRAIEQCRTTALGGHVEQCDACGPQRIATIPAVLHTWGQNLAHRRTYTASSPWGPLAGRPTFE